MKVVNWEYPSTKLNLLENEVHIWLVNLKISNKQITELTHILSQDEKVRANSFKFAEHKNRFITARGSLRQIISYYLQISSQEITFKYSDRGKPIIQNSNLQFNISHSQDLALSAFTNKHLIGIDLEYLRNNVECIKIAQKFFTSTESQLINSLPEDKQQQTFFHFWTVKEAYLKATGEGLVGGLDTVEIDLNVDLDSDAEVRVKAIAKQLTKNNNWFFSSFIPEKDFIATVAINTRETDLTIKYFTLN
jgi:4'-phosphopantetheinyl transferase